MQVEAFLYTTAPLQRSPQLDSWTAARRRDRVQTGGSYGGAAAQGKKSLFGGVWGRRDSCVDESSWAPRVASFCWAAHPVQILSWSRNRRQRPTRRCPCGLCTGCCQTSSSSGSGRCPWPSPEHELQRVDKKQRNQTPVDKAQGH